MSVRVSYVGNQYDNIKLTINSDTTNYSSTDLYGNSSSAASLRLTAETSMRLLNAANADATTTNTFSNVELYIPSYTSTSAKQFSTYSVLENNDSAANTAFILSMANLYRGTSAITQLALAPNFGTNFVSGSSFYLYGI
jgi:hypothetical protein